MRLTLFFLLLAFVCSAFGAQIGFRPQRSAPESLYHKRSTKGQHIKGTPQVQSRTNLENNLRKGEYVCGNKICKLQPGEVPPNCNGMCQYRIN